MSKQPIAPDPKQECTNLDTAFQILEGIQEQVRFADAKAGFIVALIAIIFGFTASNVSDIKILVSGSENVFLWLLRCLPLFVYAFFSVASAITAVAVVISRFGGAAPQTKVFFVHIIGKYGRDYHKYVSDMKKTKTDEWIEEVGSQVLEVSHIASQKHTWFRRSAKFAVVAIIAWVIVLGQAFYIAATKTISSADAPPHTSETEFRFASLGETKTYCRAEGDSF